MRAENMDHSHITSAIVRLGTHLRSAWWDFKDHCSRAWLGRRQMPHGKKISVLGAQTILKLQKLQRKWQSSAAMMELFTKNTR